MSDGRSTSGTATGAPPELLRGVPFFAVLSDEDLQALAQEFLARDYADGEAIVIEGQQGYAFFVVERGSAKVTVRGEQRRVLGPGSPFGELALFDHGARRSASVIADGDVRCWSLPIFSFRPFVEARPAVAWQLLEYLAVQLRSRDPRASEVHDAQPG